MISIGAVWDRTMETFAARTGMLATIAGFTYFLPGALQALTTDPTPGAAPSAAGGIAGIAAGLLAMWGTLTIGTLASRPDASAGEALAQGGRAVPRALAAAVVLVIAALVLFVPGLVLLARSGIDMAALAREDMRAAFANASLGGFSLYTFVFSLFAVWAGARLTPLYAVLANEPLTVGAIPRSFRLTQGWIWKIVGVLILYVIVFLVALAATRAVFGTVFLLLMGADDPVWPARLAGVATAAVTAGFAVLQSVFTTRLYVAARYRFVDPAPHDVTAS